MPPLNRSWQHLIHKEPNLASVTQRHTWVFSSEILIIATQNFILESTVSFSRLHFCIQASIYLFAWTAALFSSNENLLILSALPVLHLSKPCFLLDERRRQHRPKSQSVFWTKWSQQNFHLYPCYPNSISYVYFFWILKYEVFISLLLSVYYSSLYVLFSL